MDEKDLIRRLKQGQQWSCNVLVDLYQKRLLKLAWGITLDREESDEKEHNAFIRHKAQCPDCRAVEARFRQADIIFATQADVMTEKLLKDASEIFIKTEERDHTPGIKGIIQPRFPGTPTVFGVLSIAVAAVIMTLTFWQHGRWPTGGVVPSPSAVVNSVDAYGSSVMILETAETHHTIIWFSET
jgi:hypothetical protein